MTSQLSQKVMSTGGKESSVGSKGYKDGYGKPIKESDYPQLNFSAQPKHIRDQTKSRLNQFVGGHFASVNLSSMLFHARVDGQTPASSLPSGASIKTTSWSAHGRDRPMFKVAKPMVDGKGKPCHKGQEFGPSWTNHWFKLDISLPAEWADQERIQLEFDCSNEAMVFTSEGLPLHGLTGGFGIERRVEYIISKEMRKAGRFTLYVEASCNELFGIDNMNPPPNDRYYRLNSLDLVVPNMPAWRLLWDFNTLHQLATDLPDDSALQNKAMYVANAMMNEFESGDQESIERARKIAERMFGKDWEATLVKKREETGNVDPDGNLWGSGHCHIDTAWLWPFSVTQQKSARSWSTQIDLMERYPEHTFSCTQAQQFKWVEELYPLLFDKIKTRVEEGRFQPLGATWVEMDTNMPSGEALCRQFLYGQRYYQDKFGMRCPTFCLPDTFGYCAQMAQIARSAGCVNFFTQKLSWNSINQFPHSTFNWVGLDGSQILTHMTPVNCYNSQCEMGEIRRGQFGHKNLEVTNHSLLLFGNGDGGGGPTPPMMERLRRARAIGTSDNIGKADIALVKMGSNFDAFFDHVREETVGGTTLPNWHGELYFELHRGTYTSHGSIKKGNRKSENLMRELEYAATMASLFGPADYEYPKKEIDVAWEDILLCQFHDVIPGSGIAMIYEDAEAKYADIRKVGMGLLENAYQALYPGSKSAESAFDLKATESLVAINTTPWLNRVEAVGGAVIATASDLIGSVSAKPDEKVAVFAEVTSASTFSIGNSLVKMAVTDGRITSLFDVAANRELIVPGESGGFVIFEDQPGAWDAWDVDIWHLEKGKRLSFASASLVDQGPMRATVACGFKCGNSHISVKISVDAVPASLRADARSLIRFDCITDWREKHRFLKFELPLDIHHEIATYDTQFGIVRRPTHRNTSWDNAKFEVCGHKFADLSEHGYGVALLSESKYGWACEGSWLRLSLLRAPTLPDPDCDMGVHEYSFAIYPHVGSFGESDVADVSYAFNNLLRVRSMKNAPAADAAGFSVSPFKIQGSKSVIIETVKRGENDDFSKGSAKTVILRLYEGMGGRASVKLQIAGLDVKKAAATNVLEDELESLTLSQGLKGDRSGGEIELTFRPFEIKTIKLSLAEPKKKRANSWVRIEN